MRPYLSRLTRTVRHSPQVHEHSSSCGHEPVRHDDHIDYVVDGQLHHLHGNHCDWHGMLSPATDPDALPSSSDMAGEVLT